MIKHLHVQLNLLINSFIQNIFIALYEYSTRLNSCKHNDSIKLISCNKQTKDHVHLCISSVCRNQIPVYYTLITGLVLKSNRTDATTSGAETVPPILIGVRVVQSFVFCAVFCRSLCGLCFLALYYLLFFILPLRITPLVSSNVSVYFKVQFRSIIRDCIHHN